MLTNPLHAIHFKKYIFVQILSSPNMDQTQKLNLLSRREPTKSQLDGVHLMDSVTIQVSIKGSGMHVILAVTPQVKANRHQAECLMGFHQILLLYNAV